MNNDKNILKTAKKFYRELMIEEVTPYVQVQLDDLRKIINEYYEKINKKGP